MFFLNPMFLWAGFAVLIPPIIHLFNFRKYKTVYFSDIRFIDNIRQTTRRKSVIKHIIIMILRMLAIAAIVIAFAQPVKVSSTMPVGQQQSAPPVIYLDNSFSMQTGDGVVSAVETAKNHVLKIVDAYPSETKFLFLTNDFSQEHFRFVNALTIRDFLQNVKISPSVRTLSEVINKAEQNLNLLDVSADVSKSMYLISDFQNNICDFDNIQTDSLTQINIVPIQPQSIANLAVDTCIFNTPLRRAGGQENISVFVKNYGENTYNNVPLALVINGKQKSVQNFSIAPGESKQLEIKYVNETQEFVNGVITIADSPVDFDNSLYFSYRLDTVTNILLIGNQQVNKYFTALFDGDEAFKIDVATDLSKVPVDLQRYKTVILNQPDALPHNLATALHTFVSSGGNLIFVPSFLGSISDYNYLLNLLQCNAIISKDTIRCNVSKVDITSSLLRSAIKEIKENTDLPYISRYFNSMSNAYAQEDVVLETDSYKKILTQSQYRSGRVFVFYCPLDEKSGNMVTHRIFVPLVYNAATMGGQMDTPYIIVGRNDGVPQKIDNFAEGSKVFLRYRDSGYEFIPRISGPDAGQNYMIFAENGAQQAGFYDLTVDGKPIATLSFNYNRNESQLNYLEADNVVDKLEAKILKKVKIVDTSGISFVDSIMQNANTEPLWRWFVFLALLFLIVEIFFERFF
ncbi:MAG: BatA domain-containing protein [Bacteroidales bacterium]|nr:BatA domain-containing protein [Bacteroidales bacterium]